MGKVKLIIAFIFSVTAGTVFSQAPDDPVSRIKPYRIEGSSFPGQIIVSDQWNDGRWNDSLYYWEGVLVINGDTAIVDWQVIDEFQIVSNVLSISLSNDGQVPHTVDLSPYLDNTDDQTLNLVSNTLSIEDGNSVDLSGYLDNTDNQQVDNFSLSGTTLTLEIEADGQAPHTVDLSSLGGDQTLTFDISSGDLTISGGNTVNIPAMDGATSGADGEQGFVPKPLAGEENLFLKGDGTWANPTTGGDNWGSQVAQTSGFIGGDGTGGDPITLVQNGAADGNVIAWDNGLGGWDARPQLDSQQVTTFSLSGTTLTLEVERDGQPPHTVNLSSLQDGTGTDDQTISLSSNTLSIEDGNSVDLSPYLDNTDSQVLNLTGNTLSLTNGGSVNLSPYLDNTDDQQVTTFSLSGTTLTLEVESDGQAPHTVNLSSLQDGTGTDDQQIANFSITADILALEIENDGQPAQTVNLSPYLDNTDTQDLSYGGLGALSLTNGGSVDLSDLLDNTDSQALSLSSNTLSLTNGGSVDLSPYLDDTDEQGVDNFSISGTTLTLEIENDGQAPHTVDISGAVGDDDWRFTGTEDYQSHAYRFGRTSIATTASTHGLRVDSTFQYRTDGGENIFDWQNGTGVADEAGLVWRAEGSAIGTGSTIAGENNLILATNDLVIEERDVLGSILFMGEDPNSPGNITTSAFIKAFAQEDWSTTNHSSHIEFYNTMDGDATPTLTLRLDDDERVDFPTYWNKDDGVPTSLIGRDPGNFLTRHPISGTPTDGDVLKVQSGGLEWLPDGGSGTADVDLNLLRDTITQTAHGFSQADTPIPFFVDSNGGDLHPSTNVYDTTLHIGFIVEVIDVNDLVVATGGVFEKPSHGYYVGEDYFTTSTAYSYDTVAPTGEINDWIFTVLDDDRLMLHNVRPYDPGGTEVAGGLWYWDGSTAEFVASTDTLGLSANEGLSLEILTDSIAFGVDLASLSDQAPTSSDYVLWEDAGTATVYRTTISQLSTGSQTLSINESTAELTISGGNTVDLSETVDEQVNTLLTSGANVSLSYNDGSNTLTISADDDQALSLVSNSLNLTNGGSVDLSVYLDNTDSQTLTLSSNDLSISGGNSVDLSGYLDNTDSQTLTANASTTELSISSGNTVSVAELIDDRTDALLTAGTGINLSYNDGSNTLEISSTASAGDPDQTLSLSGTDLTISGTGGNTVDLSSLQDGTGTDDQEVESFSIVGDILGLEIENDGQAIHTVDLSGYLDNTDEQDLSFNSSLVLNISGGSGVNLAENIEDHLYQDVLQSGSGISISYNDSSGEITISASGGVSNHANTHIRLGSDEINGDQLDIDWNPSNYDPGVLPSEVFNVDHLTAHLFGIDTEIEKIVPDDPGSQTSGNIDWDEQYQKAQEIDMTGASSKTIVFANPQPGGAYIVWFTGADDSDSVTWPSNVYYETGTSAGDKPGTDILDSGRRMVQLLYDGSNYIIPGGYN